MDGFTVAGDGGFTACELDGGTAGQLASYLDVGAGTPALYAAIGDPATGRALDPAIAKLTVTGPDGTGYNTAVSTVTQFASVSAGHLQALLLLQPMAGRWTISAVADSTGAASAAGFRAMLATVPVAIADVGPLACALGALTPHFPGDTSGSQPQVGFDLLRWGMWPFAVAAVTARAASGLALDLAGLISAAFGIDAASAGRAVTEMAGQAAPGALLTIARQGGLTPPGATLDVLANGDAADGLTGWQITDNGGAGWTVQSGYSGQIGYGGNFAASYAWCRKQQVINLVGQAGLTPAFLDTGPSIIVTDWVAAPAPDGAQAPSSYQLTVQLLGASGAPVKELTTGVITLPAAGPQPQWQRVQFGLDGYGPGVRSVSFAHGGLSGGQWDAGYGVKLTGAGVSVQLAPAAGAPAELLANNSGQDGLTGWTSTPPSPNPWTVDPAAGLSCPASPGATAFAVASGTGAKQQVVDLVAAGLRPDFLDTSPALQAGQWIAAAPGGACSYSVTAELLDAQQAVIATLATGTVQVAAGPQRFTPLLRAISGYPAGLRSVRFTHTAQAAATGPACVAGATLQVLVPQPPPAALAAAAAQAVTGPVRVPDPASRPYWWVCYLQLYSRSGFGGFGSGSVITNPNGVCVLTAAHCMVQRYPMGWFTRITALPGSGSANMAGGTALQFPIEFLTANQGDPPFDGSFDYGLIRTTATDWQPGGFVPLPEDDAAMDGQAVTLTAFPAEEPFTMGVMYTDDLTATVYGPVKAKIPTTFTGGASGGPVYVRGTENVVGVFSHSGWLPNTNLFDQYMQRLDALAVDRLQRWTRPLAATDRVCSLQLVIHTGQQPWAGTDDPISLTFGGHVIPLDPLWMPESGSSWSAKETDHFDGYDLSPALRTGFPGGLLVSTLSGMAYELRRMSDSSWTSGDWYVESLNFFVNGQRYYLQVTDAWVTFNGGRFDAITDTLP